MPALIRFYAVALVFLLQAPALSAMEFGRVDMVTGAVTVQLQDGQVYNPRTGDSIPSGAELVTGRDGELHIETADSGFVALRPNTRLRVQAYRAEGDENDNQILSLLRGSFRSVTGWIGRYNPDRYKIVTPTATIGVRGTDHEPAYMSEEDAALNPGAEPGTYDTVNEGGSFIENDNGRIDVRPSQAGFAHKNRHKPRRLERVPGWLKLKATRNESRIKERRETLKKNIEKRRAEKRGWHQKRQERINQRKQKQRRSGDDSN